MPIGLDPQFVKIHATALLLPRRSWFFSYDVRKSPSSRTLGKTRLSEFTHIFECFRIFVANFCQNSEPFGRMGQEWTKNCLPARKVTKFSSLQILQSGCNPRHLNSKAFLDCSGLHLDYMDCMVIKWIAEQGNPMQSKGNLCNPSAIHCNIGLQFGFAIQSNLCNLTAMQEDCSQIAEIAL